MMVRECIFLLLLGAVLAPNRVQAAFHEEKRETGNDCTLVANGVTATPRDEKQEAENDYALASNGATATPRDEKQEAENDYALASNGVTATPRDEKQEAGNDYALASNGATATLHEEKRETENDCTLVSNGATATPHDEKREAENGQALVLNGAAATPRDEKREAENGQALALNGAAATPRNEKREAENGQALALNGAAAHPEARAYRPDRFPEDSLTRRSDERNRRIYDSIRSKTDRHAVPRMLYRWITARPVRDTTQNGQVLDESRELAVHEGKTIGDIVIEREEVFRPGGNWFERTGNKLHRLTRERVIRRDLLFRTGDRFDPRLVVRNKQLLRSRRYISDVEIAVRPDTLDTTRVDLILRTRDSWTISVDVGIHSEGRTTAGLSDANILGWGNRLAVKTNFSRKDFAYGGNVVEYEIPNVLGTFYTADFAAGRDFYKSTLDAKLQKEFLRPTDYEAGLSYSNLKFKQYMIEQDTSLLVKVRNFDLWGGYSRYLKSIASSVFLTAHYNCRRFGRRPDDVSATHHPALHDREALLFGAGLYSEKFLSANMIYGFGTREYLATGYKAEAVSGYTWGEFDEGIYLGVSCKAGGFCRAGYIMGGFALGSNIDRLSGKWNRSAVDIDLQWFSPLFILRRSRVRQFLKFNYTQGWNRDTGNDESIRFTERNGLQAFDKHVIGTNRTVLDTETVVFTPWQPLGFRIAFFGFADFGLIGYSPNTFKNDFFASLGGGIRIKNERLVFSTIQIRLGMALGKKGFVGSDWFRLSSSTRLEQYRYRPERPETIGFE